MKRVIGIVGILALTACGEGTPSSGGGTGFSGGPVEKSATRVVQPNQPSQERLLATVKPAVLEKMRAQPPVKVFAGQSTLSAQELLSLNDNSLEAIRAALPKLTIFGGFKGREQFRAGLIGGGITRVRVNGLDFAVLEANRFRADEARMNALIAYRANCVFNGQSRVRNETLLASPYSVWYVGLNC